MARGVLAVVSANVRRLRARAGLTQEALAERAGVTPRAVQRIEEGVDVRLTTLARVAGGLGVEPRELLAPVTEPPPPRVVGRPRTRRR